MNKKVLIYFFLVLTGFLKLNAAVCTATASGNWHNPAIWSCGTVPQCGDHVVIPNGFTVTVAAQADYSGCAQTMTVVVQGVVKFNTGFKLSLPCGSAFYLAHGGQLVEGNGSGNSNWIQICGDTYWNAGMGSQSGELCYPPGCETPLPVTLINFNGSLKKDFVELSWITASENNNDYFKIQRSNDGIEFYQIGRVKSQHSGGNGTMKAEYTFMDDNLREDLYYYRLAQVDINGTTTLSKIIVIKADFERNFKFVLYPNPNKGEFTVDFSGLDNKHLVSIELRSMDGKKVYESSFTLNSGSTSVQIVPEDKIASGVYFCTFSLEGIEYTVKVAVN